MIALLQNQKFKPFIPHAGLFAALFLILIIGVISNSSLIGSFFGTTAAMAIDAPCLLAGLVIGFAFYSYRGFILGGVFVASLVSFYVSISVTEQREMMGLPSAGLNIFILRIVSILILAHLFNIFRILCLKNLNIFNLQKTEGK